MANPVVIIQGITLVKKHWRKLVALPVMVIVAALALPLVLLLGLFSVVAIAAGGAQEAFEGEPGNVPGEYLDMVLVAGQECLGVPASILAAIAAATSGWDANYDDGAGRVGLMWLPQDVVDHHFFDTEPDGVAQRTSPGDSLMMSATWLCDLTAQAREVAITDTLTTALAGFEAPTYTLSPLPVPGQVTELVMDLWADYLWLDHDLTGGPGGDGWGAPVANPHVTSSYGKRDKPCATCSDYHLGTDLRAACGTSLWAAAAGTVTFAGPSQGYGNRIDIDHGEGTTTRYAHMYSGGIHVGVGQSVERGDLIGASGSAGSSTACHLHFEVIVGSQRINPEPFMAARGVTFTH